MSQIVDLQAPESYSWFDTWTKALTKPTEASYQELITDPAAGPGRAYAFIAVTAAISFLIAYLLHMLFGLSIAGENFLFSSALGLVCGLPFAIGLTMLALTVSAGLLQWVAGMLGGTGNFSKLVYAFACFFAPMSVATSILSAAPIINLLVYPLMIYNLFLEVVAIKAVNGFSWGKSIITMVVPMVVLFGIVCGLTILFLALLGPTIGNIFSNIVQQTAP